MKRPRPCEKCEELATARWELYLAHQNEHFEQERKQDIRVALIVGAVLFAGILILFSTGCAAHSAPDGRPTPLAKVYAELTVFPPLSIAYRPITLTARLIDPGGVVSCPGITWTMPDGTHPAHVADCDPDDPTSGHVESKRGMLPPGEFRFEVEFDSQGRRWRAQRTVSIPGAE